MTQEEIVDLMAKTHLFEGVPLEVLTRLVDHGRISTVSGGEVMIQHGKIGQAVIVLLNGTVSVLVDDEESHQMNKPGTILGEISAVSHTPATATVRAATDVQVLEISHQDFHKVLTSSETLASSVLRSLSKYL